MRFLLRRLGFFVLTLWAAITLNFFIPRMMPGDPVSAMKARLSHGGHVVDVEQLRAMLQQFGFDPGKNIAQQYVEYLRNMVTGHWGVSIGGTLGAPVTKLIGQALPWTLGLVGVTTLLAFLLGTFVGIIAGWRRGGFLDSVLPPMFVVTSALPYFWVALLLIVLFANGPHALLPNDNNYDIGLTPAFTGPFIVNVLKHAVLPAATILITAIGGWILTMRNNMITTLGEDYVRMARAKGLSNRRVMMGYAARNAFLPNLSGFAMSLGFVIAGTILVEYVFNYPGLGHMFYSATISTDYPLLQALFLLVTLAVLICVLLCDFAVFLLDPRARAKG
ncbi:MAG: peptide/nickel transport system permease protein [Frankiaceae bacterium]|nr:peptide/nickel transport system permease protein [Frankiaceae bacterium]